VLIIAISTIGGTVGGFVYGYVQKAMKKWTYPIGSVITATGALILYYGSTIAMMQIGALIAGFAWMFIMSSCYLNINLTAPAHKISTFNGYAILANNLGLFVAIYVVDAFSMIFGRTGSLRFPIFQWAVVMLGTGLLFAIRAPTAHRRPDASKTSEINA
jgi:MFS family permease